jgi:hypothetical protein
MLSVALPAAVARADAIVPSFVHAVAERITLLGGTPHDPNTPTTFTALQSDVQNFAAHFYDPLSCDNWDIPTLLERASGRSTWMGESSLDAKRVQQISQVFGLLTWRQQYSFGYDLQRSKRYVYAFDAYRSSSTLSASAPVLTAR